MTRQWIDLRSQPGRGTARADICIIGAGAVGCYLAHRLVMAGHRVLVLDAGPVQPTPAAEVGFSPILDDGDYPGATKGRYFGVGGSTAHWGGALVPHGAHDLLPGTGGTAWGGIVQQVQAHAGEVLTGLGFAGDTDFEGFARRHLGTAAGTLAMHGIDAQANVMLPFRKKNMTGLLLARSPRGTPIQVVHHAVAKAWHLQQAADGEGRITMVEAVSRNGNTLAIVADRYLLAAGAIESARTLLELNASHRDGVLRATVPPGYHLSDHLSAPIATVHYASREGAVSLFAPRFDGGWLRSIRLLDRLGTPPGPRHFTHFTFPIEGPGFVLTKAVLGGIQRREVPRIDAKLCLAGAMDVARLATERCLRSRLYVPAGLPIGIQLDMEQEPDHANRVTLSASPDEYGRPRARIRWNVTARDIEAFNCLARRFLRAWPGSQAGFPTLQPCPVRTDSQKPYDAYHPVGTLRMGNGSEAVVDPQLRVRGLANLWAISTGVLPTAGTANPTFTVLCLAHGLAGQFGRGQRD